MDIDKAIENLAKEILQETKEIKRDSAEKSQDQAKNLEDLSISDLKKLDTTNEEVRRQIYIKLRSDIEIFIDNFLQKSYDSNADKGMYKCSLETWQSCAKDIGTYYFNNNRYLRKDSAQAVVNYSSQVFDDNMLSIGLELYEDFCISFRKQFFIYDCCKFLGMNKDSMYKLSEMRADLLKKGHTAQESSMRTALASGRSNVTAMAILLNHDYDYTRTTQVIHTSEKKITADCLPILENNSISDSETPQHIVQNDVVAIPEIDNNM